MMRGEQVRVQHDWRPRARVRGRVDDDPRAVHVVRGNAQQTQPANRSLILVVRLGGDSEGHPSRSLVRATSHESLELLLGARRVSRGLRLQKSTGPGTRIGHLSLQRALGGVQNAIFASSTELPRR